MISGVGNRMTREIARQSRLADQIQQTQIQVSTGTKVQRQSDDTRAFGRASQIRMEQANVETWTRNVEYAGARVAQADVVLSSASGLVARARELMVAASSGTISATDRGAIAGEISAIADEISQLSGSNAPNGESLFPPGTGGRVSRFDTAIAFAPIPDRNSVWSVGGRDAALILSDAANAVRSGVAVDMAAAQTETDAAINHLAGQRAAIGMAGARLERIGESLAERAITMSAERSALVDTNLTEAIASLNAQTITLEAAQAAFARINRQTLFDLLR